SPRGLSSPLMTTLVVTAPAPLAPATATTSVARSARIKRLPIFSPFVEAAIARIYYLPARRSSPSLRHPVADEQAFTRRRRGSGPSCVAPPKSDTKSKGAALPTSVRGKPCTRSGIVSSDPGKGREINKMHHGRLVVG